MANDTDRASILAGLTNIVWGLAWADHVEEWGCANLSGVEITSVMPPVPETVRTACAALAAEYEGLAGMPVEAMFAAAVRGGFTGSAERFGDVLAHEAMGTGVALEDDGEVDYVLPYIRHCQASDVAHEVADVDQCEACKAAGDLVVHVRSSEEYTDEEGRAHSEPGPNRVNTVYLDVRAPNARVAKAFANRHQSACGSYWECEGNLVYNILFDRKGLVADLRAEGYRLDLGEYTSDVDEATSRRRRRFARQ